MTQLSKLQNKSNDYITFQLYTNIYQKQTSNTYDYQNANFAPAQELTLAQELPTVHEVMIGIGTS